MNILGLCWPGGCSLDADADVLCVPQVMVPEAETRAGLTLKPHTFPLTVTDRPVMDVAFVQFLASVSGKVSCLGKMSFESKNRWLQRSRQVGGILVSCSLWDSVKGGSILCTILSKCHTVSPETFLLWLLKEHMGFFFPSSVSHQL